MATQLQIRRGTAAQVAAFTGAEGEIVYNSTNDSLHTNDGATAGGFELARADLNNVSDADLNAALTGNTLSALTITTLTAGAGTFSGTVTADGLTVDGAPANLITVSRAGAVGNTNTAIQFTQLTANNYFGADASNALVIGTNLNLAGSRTALFAQNHDVSFYEDTGTTAKLFWDASAESLGIGTSSPAVKLHTESGVARTSTAKTETAFFSSTDGDDFRFGLAVSHKGGAADADRYASLDSTAYRVSTDTFATGGSLVLQELGGNVGIGGSPSKRFHVFGPDGDGEGTPVFNANTVAIFQNNGTSTDSAVLNILAGSASTGLIGFGDSSDSIRQAIVANMSDDSLELRAGNNSTALTISASGNLGIGTSSPAALIHGMSGDLFLTANSTAANSGQGLFFQSTTSGWATSAAHAAIYGKRTDASNGYLRFDTRQSGTTQEAMRIDASGNLLVGTTSEGSWGSTAGFIARPNGTATISSANPSIYINRLTTDGDIAVFRKDGTTVGSIGTEGGDLTIGNGDAGIQFVNGTEHFRPQNMTTNSATDGLMNIGSAAYRFKDLYLSGNANVASVVASSSVISPFFTTGSFSYTSGTTEIITIPQDSIYLFMSRPNNYGGSDNRHGAVYIIRRWSSSVGSTELAASAAGRGVFTIATGGTVTYGSTGAGVPSTAIYWMRIA